jgi:hypothetical protein
VLAASKRNPTDAPNVVKETDIDVTILVKNVTSMHSFVAASSYPTHLPIALRAIELYGFR